ncbi:site-specific integrase [Halalkalibacterium halodurans]|uniref:tyrosine-type recombinase/integrase n=1 Tax=Halalkalibacterium halodurans TaxID=86665 RepID=UPI002E22146F
MKGSIEKRGKNSWRLRVDLGYHPDGTRNRPSITVTVEDKALLRAPKRLQDYLEHQLALFKQDVLSGNYIKPSMMTLSDFVNKEWKEKYAKDELSPTTYDVYCNHLESRILPAFGHQQMDKISTIQIVTFLKGLQQPGVRKDGKKGVLGIETVQYIYRVLNNVFERAEKWKFIMSNPMHGVAKPKLPKSAQVAKAKEKKEKPNYYSEEEAQQVVDALYQEPRKWRLLILGSMIGGFRRGELIGLEWNHVKFDEEGLEIENNIPLTKNGKPVEKGPKTISSYRFVDMPEWYMEELKLYKEEWEQERKNLGDKWQGGDREFVFHNGAGQSYYYQHPSKWWRRFCKRHNIRYITFHGLRHSMGTLLIEDEDSSNVDALLKAIQERLGHSRKSTTEDIYVHVTKKVKKRTTGKFDKFARNNETSPTQSKPQLRRVK